MVSTVTAVSASVDLTSRSVSFSNLNGGAAHVGSTDLNDAAHLGKSAVRLPRISSVDLFACTGDT